MLTAALDTFNMPILFQADTTELVPLVVLMKAVNEPDEAVCVPVRPEIVIAGEQWERGAFEIRYIDITFEGSQGKYDDCLIVLR